jgi:hypothetical protein
MTKLARSILVHVEPKFVGDDLGRHCFARPRGAGKQCIRAFAEPKLSSSEWTPEDRLRHASFIGLRPDRRARDVVKET